MIYLSIPHGMTFKKITFKEEVNGIVSEESKDYFVDPDGKKPNIPLQDLVKDALRNHKRQQNCIKLKEFTIYMYNPPNIEEIFLVYTPERNGKNPTTTEPHYIDGRVGQKFNPNQQSRYGSFWFHHINLPPEKQQQIVEKMQEQKENRRHYGDNPLAT